MIDDIQEIVQRHNGVTLALTDVEGRHALLMCLLQIGEKLNQVKSESIRSELPVTGAYSVRNFIAHDYGGVNLGLIESIVRKNIPELRTTIEGILSR
jgi:uncharacterized protein with HEPN domain